MKYFFTLIIILSTIFIGSINAQNTNKDNDSIVTIDSITSFIKFANKIIDAVDNNNRKFLTDNFDQATINQILTQVPDSIYKETYRKSINKGLESFLGNLHHSVNSGNYYDFISYSKDKEENCLYAICRFYSETSGINYHQYKIKPVDTTFIIQDIYIMLTGEYISAMLSNTFKNSFVKDSEKDADLYQKFLVLRNMGMNKRAYSVAKKIRDSAFINKSFLILKANSAEAVDTEEYKNCLKEVLEKYPKDPSLILISLDYYHMIKDFNNLFRAIDELKSYTDDDFLEYFTGNYAYEIGEFQMAKESFEFIVEEYPSFVSAEIMLLHTYNALENNTEALQLLDTMIANGYSKDKLIDFIKSDIHDFYKTRDFKNWKKQH